MSARPPADLGAAGRRLWLDVLAVYGLTKPATAVLHEACRTRDVVDRLTAELAAADLVVEGSKGQPAANPLLAEVRMQRDLFGRLMARLALPDVDPDGDERDVIETAAARLGRRGADARWRGRKG